MRAWATNRASFLVVAVVLVGSSCAADDASRGPALSEKSEAAEWSATLGGAICASQPNVVGACAEGEPMEWLYAQWDDPDLIEANREVRSDLRYRRPGMGDGRDITFPMDLSIYRGSDCLDGCPSNPETVQIELPFRDVHTTTEADLQYVWVSGTVACAHLLRGGTRASDWFWFADAAMVSAFRLAFYMYPGWIQCG